MTNREIINFAKENGFIDITTEEFETCPTVNGTLKQKRQKDYLLFEKKIEGCGYLRITVANDRWSSDGVTVEDRITTSNPVWFNENLNNEDVHKSGAIKSIELVDNTHLFVKVKTKFSDGRMEIITHIIRGGRENDQTC